MPASDGRGWWTAGVLAATTLLLGAIAAMVLLGGAPQGDASLAVRIPTTRVADIVLEVDVHATPGGPSLGWTVGGPFEAPAKVAILGDSVVATGTQWVRIYVLPHRSVGGGDVFVWIPISVNGKPTLDNILAVDCPPTTDNIATIAALDPIARARCLRGATFTVHGIAGVQQVPSSYTVQPDWFDGWGDGSSNPFSIRKEGPGFQSFDVVQPAASEAPPRDFTIALTAHVADPRSVNCARTPIDNLGRPPESRDDSILWCTTRIVADSWTIDLGPEGRPIDPAHPQVRHASEGSHACAGVNGGVMRVRIDASAVDPIWLEGQGGYRQIPTFAPGFELAYRPDLVLVDPRGDVVARDGDLVDTNGTLAGYPICPTGYGVTIG